MNSNSSTVEVFKKLLPSARVYQPPSLQMGSAWIRTSYTITEKQMNWIAGTYTREFGQCAPHGATVTDSNGNQYSFKPKKRFGMFIIVTHFVNN